MGNRMHGPKLEASDAVHKVKYRSVNEDFRESQNRVAGALQDNHEHYMVSREALLQMIFLPPGRVQASMGSLKLSTSHNCFVMPTIHDSFTDGPTEEELSNVKEGEHEPASIMDVAKMAAQTMRQGGGVGYDFSTLRPSGDVIHGVQSTTDGPMAFAPVFDAICSATSSAGNRRGAQMMVMRIDHPDIEQFIRAKQVSDDNIPWHMRPLRGFNMSIAVTEQFLEHLKSEKPFPLQFGGRVYRHIDPLALWDMIMRGTYDWAEPGVLFIDQINRMNNLHYCETIAATNPCGEQPLPPHGACLLGSHNMTKLITKSGDSYEFDEEKFLHYIPHIVRSMDNVIDRGRYPLEAQKQEAVNKRRMGLGVTGLANALEAMGLPYGSPQFVAEQGRIMHIMHNEAYRASALLAKEKGAFPLFDKEQYMKGKVIQNLDDDVQDLISRYGIRNSHLTSVAPTGTISFGADNVSSGIEPVIAYEQDRTVIMPDGPVTYKNVPDYGYANFGVKGKTILEVTAKEHIDVLITAQENVDSAVSKTCNVPTEYPFEDFKNIYIDAAERGAKGCTTYRPAGNYDEPIKAAEKPTEASGEACGFDPVTGQRTGACAD